MVTALNVSNNILERSFNETIDITPMKLQKLLYFVYREYYKSTGRRLFDERFETWKYGPVLPTVYSEFKSYKANSIKDYVRESDKSVLAVNEDSSYAFKQALDLVWNKCKNIDGIALSSWTHRSGTAWRIAAEKGYLDLLDEDIKAEEGWGEQ